MATPHYPGLIRPVTGMILPTKPGWDRRRFIGTCLAACCATALRTRGAVTGNNNDFRGGKVEWARLHNPGQYWNRHAEADPELLDFIRRNTTLNIDTTWRAAGPKSLADLCSYPFLFTDRVENLDPTDARNLAEYMRRGGFLFIDCCCNTGINPSATVFFNNQIRFLNAMLPDIRIETLPDNHDVYTLYFKTAEHPPRAKPGNSWMDSTPLPLHALYLGKRLVGMFSMSGLQCAWAHVGSPDNARECLEMMTNIYLYAITH